MTQPEYRVLVADDDPTVGLLMPAALAGQGFAVTVVDNGKAALNEFERTPFDIILLDVEMPEMDGFAVCSAIRQRRGGEIPVVLVTGHTEPAFIQRAYDLGADYIAKPLDWSLLGGLLRNLLQTV
ncbi:hypothetical protein AT959_08395 [Dechloromonas denitrificans]|uniref:Response regulatory domain-containing protein n=1 Tax=Dechloromonas denitrificans TaxID=281362 RepID=A0A133XII3_9RHOO|nr:response regulator [Dechloromonas denitrificans]KXB30742.1 hypothetical protein AT959_08395 [Dechloromonas denitrificans]